VNENEPTEFERTAAQGETGFFSDFWHFLRQNKKWWLLPIIVLMLLFGVLMLLSTTGAAPFIYTLF
jgi:hypothetical protein